MLGAKVTEGQALEDIERLPPTVIQTPELC